MSVSDDATRLLDTAETLFYENGYQAVGMAALKSSSGLALKKMYSLYPSKDAIIVAVLDRRDERWHRELRDFVDDHPQTSPRVLAVFDWLGQWLATEGHRGCAWINAFGELGGTSLEVADAVRTHKARFREYIAELLAEDDAPPELESAIYLLAEGCMVTAGITGSADSARDARLAAAQLLAP